LWANGDALPEIVRALPAGLDPEGERMREKIFGPAPMRRLCREGKIKLMHKARCLARSRALSRAALVVLDCLVWAFHGPQGRLFPSLEAIAARAGVARSTAAAAIKALEAAGLVSWVHRLRRVRVRSEQGDGWRWRCLRASNAYVLTGAEPEPRCESDHRTGPRFEFQDSSLSAALDRLKDGLREGKSQTACHLGREGTAFRNGS
jgi:DNA-binding MarR family transcriptional regulator